MSDWMKVLPCRGVEVDATAQQIEDEWYTLISSRGLVGIDREDGWWEVYYDGGREAMFGSIESAVWFVITNYGEGACDWDSLYKALFGEVSDV